MASIHHIYVTFNIVGRGDIPEGYDVELRDNGCNGWSVHHDGMTLMENIDDRMDALSFASELADDLARDYN